MAAVQLDSRGWHLTSDSVTELDNDEKGNIDNIIKKILDRDFIDIGGAWLNDDINTGTVDYINGPGVLQLQELRNISSPKNDKDESQVMPSVCLLSLTDGHITCSAVTLEPINGLCVNTPPGSKVLLSGTVDVDTNFLLLTNENTSLLGGWVSSLAEPWELQKQTQAKSSETKTNVCTEEGPPPFVPFEQKITSEMLLSLKTASFKSLSKNKIKEPTQEDIEFQRLRQAAIQEALHAKNAKVGQRISGGQQLLVNNRDAASIHQMGFSPEKVLSALKISNGNESQAMNILLSEQRRYQRDGYGRKPEFTTRPFSQTLPSSSHKYGYGSYQGNQGSNFNQIRQQQVGAAPEFNKFGQMDAHRGKVCREDGRLGGGRDNSYTNKSSTFSGQNKSLLKEDSQKQRDGLIQNNLESNQSHTSQEQQLQSEQNNCIDKHNLDMPVIENKGTQNFQGQQLQNEKKVDSSKHYTNSQEGPFNQNGKTQNLKELDVENKQINSNKLNTDYQRKAIEPSEGAYRRSSSADQVASNQQHNYHHCINSNQRGNMSYGNTSGPHQHFRGQDGSRSYSEQFPVNTYRHQPSQERVVTAPFGRQGYGPKQPSLNGYLPLNIGDMCLARYWADQKFYRAVVHAFNGKYVTVEFVDYGDVVGVDITHIQPVSHQIYQGPHSLYGKQGGNLNPHAPAYFPGAFVPAADSISRPGYNYKERRQYRPTQENYRPP